MSGTDRHRSDPAAPPSLPPGTGTVGHPFRPHTEALLRRRPWRGAMSSLIYLVGLVVVILAVLSFFGLR